MASLASLETVDGVIDKYSSQSKRVKTSVQTKKDDLSFEKVKALYKGIDDIIIPTEDGPVSVGKAGDVVSRLHSIAEVPIADMSNKALQILWPRANFWLQEQDSERPLRLERRQTTTKSDRIR